MVVARRTPGAPAPSASRSNSSNLPSKPNKSKTSQPTPTSNGKASPPTTKNSKSPVKKTKKSTGSCHSRLFLLLLSAFAVYTVAICPTDFPRTSPVCHSLDLYRAHILDPYIVPPIEALVHHADPYITPLKPYASSAAQFTRTHVAPRASSAIDFTVTQYQTHVAPHIYRVVVEHYWNGLVKPTYYNNIHPHVEHHSRPYRIYYTKFIAPNAQKALSHVTTTYVRFRPYAEHYLSEAQRHTINTYEIAQPYAIEAYRRVLPYAVRVSEQAKVHAVFLAGQAGDARRQFVDPHIIQIWEKVRDLSTTPSASSSEVSKPSATQTFVKPTPAPSASSIVAEPEPTQALDEEPTPVPSTTTVVPVIQTPEPEHVDFASESAPEPEPEQEAEPEVPASSQEETAETATPTPSSSSSLEPSSSSSEAEVPPSPTPVAEEEEAEIPAPSAAVSVTSVPVSEHEAAAAASVVAASLHVAAEPVIETEPEPVPEPEESASTPAPTEDVNDFLEGLGLSAEEQDPEPQTPEAVDDFLKDLGVSADEPAPAAIPEPSSAETQTETQAPRPTYGDAQLSPEERAAQTAKKRAEITGRHERWQADLDARVRTELQSVHAALSVSRLTAAAHLAEWGPDKKGVVAEVESEAGKLLKGLEAYVQSVEDKARKIPGGKQARKEQMGRDKEMWKKVLEKVEVRFTEKVRDLQREVHEWYVGVQAQELKDIEAVAETVKLLAERAQADLGLDYAWLDDVTYYDWQKYHDLMRTSENFTSQAQRIQAQVEPAGTNELVDALNELEREVNDLVDGFDVLVSNIIRRAEDGVFGAGDSAEPEPETTTGSETAEQPVVSVLPIEPEEEVVVPVEDVFVGRAKEEVESKLAGVPVENVHAGREEL